MTRSRRRRTTADPFRAMPRTRAARSLTAPWAAAAGDQAASRPSTCRPAEIGLSGSHAHAARRGGGRRHRREGDRNRGGPGHLQIGARHAAMIGRHGSLVRRVRQIAPPVADVFAAVTRPRQLSASSRPAERAGRCARAARSPGNSSTRPASTRSGDQAGAERAHRVRLGNQQRRVRHAGRDDFRADRRRRHARAGGRVRLEARPSGLKDSYGNCGGGRRCCAA